MKTKHIVYITLGLIFSALIIYRLTQGSGPGKGGAGKPGSNVMGKGGPSPATRVNGIVVKAESFANSLSVSGSIEANEQVQLRSEIPGLVTGIYFQEGSFVKKGQLLLKINDRELQAQLSQALTKQNLASQSEYRAKLLLEKEAISKEDYDVALADLRSLQSQTQVIRAQLSKSQIRAPFSGKIGLRNVSVGEYLIPTTSVANLVSINPVKILLSVPEKYAGQIGINTKLNFSVAGSSRTYKANIYAIEPSIEMTTRTLQIKARADNPSGQILPGSFAKIDLPLSNVQDAILIPSEAIIPVLKGKKVFISKQGKAQEVMVETGTRTDKSVLVTSGLSIGDTVLTTGMMSLKPETPVMINILKN
ncbi:efflux RND transporter periplasmic adaptor subunit [Daejeonella oryzae]|uniref:efflux RND transporter periplasmic adaptor subunit n=1 Tax=Daejeonella oryzae TaxID=1122943 RepID=UPI000409EEB5|nr:efflux RND transporter periplasmic adaptor subunit [Daejeonella oryzae]